MDARSKASFTWVYAVVFALALCVFGFGVFLAARGEGYAMLAAGSVSLVAVLITWPIALGAAANTTQSLIDLRLNALSEQVNRATSTLSLIAEQQLISDRAKQVAYREKDRDAFRRAIQEDLVKQDYEAALALVEEMDRNFGYKQEAERIRKEILDRRDEATRRQIDAAAVVIDRYCDAEQWQAAMKEVERLQRLFPDQVRVQTLASDVEEKRQGVKRTLITKFQEYARTQQIDDAITTLKRLDVYLTPAEGTAIEEEARLVFREKMNRLRGEFTNAIQAGRTADAIRVGESIVNEFPNTQMAREIRERMDILRTRLRQEQEAAQGVAAPV